MACVEQRQAAVARGIECNLGNNADAQSQFHVGFDHVAIERFEHDIGRQFGSGERGIQLAAAGKGHVIRNDGMAGDGCECQRPALGQLMAFGYDDGVAPRQIRERCQQRFLRQRLGRDANVSRAVQQLGCDLAGVGLLQNQADLGKGFAKFGDHGRQHVARLRVSRGDAKFALVALAELLADPLDIARVDQHPLDDRDQLASGFRQPEKALALALEKGNAKFFFQILDVLADTRLRRIQCACYLGQVEVVFDRFAQNPQLLEIHDAAGEHTLAPAALVSARAAITPMKSTAATRPA